MDECDLETPILLSLREREANGGSVFEASIRTIAAAMGLENTLADRLRLASTLSALESDGLVTSRSFEADDVECTDVGAEATAPSGDTADTPAPSDAAVDGTEDGGDAADGTSYRLTAAGREQADDRYAQLEAERVVVVTDDDRCELPLGTVPDAYDIPLSRALASRTSDGTISLESALEPAFVGRESERDRLAALLERARDGQSSVALLAGGPGIGKTALVERLCADASDRGFETAIGRCRRDGGAPYHPFRDAFDDRDDAEPLPFVDSPSPPVHDDATYDARLEAVYDRTAAWLEDRAAERPLVLAIDDLQWADTATVELLTHVLETVDDAPLAVICTGRPEGPETDGQLVWISEAVGRRASAVRLELEPLDREPITELVGRHVGDRDVPPTFVDAIAEETGGNPLFVVETVEHMLETERIDPTHDYYPERPDKIAVADIVQTTVGARLERLDAATRAVLETGAVIGDIVPLSLLQTVTRHAASTCREYVDRLVESGLWQRTDETTVRFESDVVRSVVRDAVDEDRATRLHRRIADAMADDDRREIDATIAHHYSRADEPDHALEHWIAAADHATTLYAHEDAVTWYERALRLAHERGRDETILTVLESLGDVHYTRGEYETADKQFRYVRDRTTDPDRVRRTYRYQARVRFERSEYEATERYATAGLDVGGDDVTREVCWLHDYRAGADMKRGHIEAALEGFRTQRELAARIDDDLLLGRAHQNMGTCYMRQGDADRAVECFDRGVSLLERAGDDRELARCLNDLGIAYLRDDRLQRATETFERCRDLAAKTGSSRVKVLALNNLAMVTVTRAQWDEARPVLEQVFDIATRVGNDEIEAITHAKLALVERATGDLEAATNGLERGLEMLGGVQSSYHRAKYRIVLGTVHLQRGAFDRAADRIESGLELAIDREFTKLHANGLLARGVLERERGNLEAALEDQRAGLDLASGLDSDSDIATHRTELAATLVRIDGEIDRALEQSRRALESVPDGYRPIDVTARIVRAGALRRSGERNAARELLGEALEDASGMSNEATLRCLLELAACDRVSGDERLRRERLAVGRDLANETGATLYTDRFEDRLEDRPADAASEETSGSFRRRSERDGKAGPADR
ncbi:ATP-binding protein [Natronorubrum tibetense]|uniref:AAA ATPase n=1 Tax=Natronorubrum tibetense GA33 TaxID=1114856 RepID=L9VXZ7_9EURY|nr:tetratricopeptide repeat protein [Natronorubrum tibetense]ELY41902.1 AAA ATPase [Natronorubrum tibetense GA33]